MKVAMYLRKSRADIEAESRGEGETLAKHRNALLKVAKEQTLEVVKIYEEIVSGESLIHRPEAIKMLQDVESNSYDAVLCMDIDRLGRGDMKDQGIILETFKQSKTKIITPRKTYDLTDEFDEEYSEFEAFMARKELKMINRRMQRGRVASVEAGNYISTYPPFGYIIKNLKNGRTLEPHPEQSEVVRLIFDLYTHPDPHVRVGSGHIAKQLNTLGHTTAHGKKWSNTTIMNIIKNQVYIGKVVWKKKDIRKSTSPDKLTDVRTRDKSEWIVAEGKHVGLISEEVFYKAEEIWSTRTHPSYRIGSEIKYPLAGIVKCAKCGGSLISRPYPKQKTNIKCHNQVHCHNKASVYELVENRIILELGKWLNTYKSDIENQPSSSNEKTVISMNRNVLKNLQKELDGIQQQKSKLHDLLEREIYDEDTYLERNKILGDKSATLQEEIEKVSLVIEQEEYVIKVQHSIIPAVESVLEIYPLLDDPVEKNSILKSVLEKVVYNKERHQIGDDFDLTIYPKLPK